MARISAQERKQRFIDTLMPAAIEVSKQTGIDPRIIVAQAAIETGWGRSAPGNNYFGIKSHGKSGGQTFTTHEVIDGKRVKIKDSFRRFTSPADSVMGYGEFIKQNPRYRPLQQARGLDAQLAALQASGYATDPAYSRKVGAVARGLDGAASKAKSVADEPYSPSQLRGTIQPSLGPVPSQATQPNVLGSVLARRDHENINALRPPSVVLAADRPPSLTSFANRGNSLSPRGWY